MKFSLLQENLRKMLWERINSGELTGLHLADQTGFKQAHISNFLNRKRGLSLEGMDRVLAAQHLSVLDLIDPAEVNKRASIVLPSENEFENIVVTEPDIAAREAQIMSMHVTEILKFKSSFFRRLKEEGASGRGGWERFVAIRVDPADAVAMYPRLLPGAALLLDRHYTALTPYRKGENNIYVIRRNSSCTVRYVERSGPHLILRPHNSEVPAELLTVPKGLRVVDCIVGRVCHIGTEA
jgi:hypothetical protein